MTALLPLATSETSEQLAAAWLASGTCALTMVVLAVFTVAFTVRQLG